MCRPIIWQWASELREAPHMFVACIVLAHLGICQQRLVQLLADGCLIHASPNEDDLLTPAGSSPLKIAQHKHTLMRGCSRQLS